MKKNIIAVTFVVCCILGVNAQVEKANLKTHQDSLSYIIGRDVGSQLKDFGATLNMSPFALGVEQAIRGQKSQVDSATSDSLRKSFASQVQKKMLKDNEAAADSNKRKADAFYNHNKKQPGVITEKDSLQYKVIKKGTGPKPNATDSVLVLYKGMLLDSTVFDSTTNGPVGFSLQRIIPGLSDGIKMMNVGSKYRFYIPPQLAYGVQGAPPRIPPNSELIFDVELVGIAGQKTPPPQPGKS